MGAVYRHPSPKIKLFEDAFVNVIKSINLNYIALSDFNINYDKGVSSQNTFNYFNHMCSIGCLRLINKPTRISKSFNTIIDHIHIKTCLLNYASPVILYKDVSNILPACIQLKLKKTKKLSKHPYIHKLNNKKINYFLAILYNKLHSREVENNYDLTKLLDIMSEVTNQYFSWKNISHKQFYILNNNPWIIPDILNAIKSKDKLYAKYLKERSSTFYSNYKK